VTFTVLTDVGNFAYATQADATGTVRLDENTGRSGGVVSGTLARVRLVQQSCSAADCTTLPNSIELSGAFQARVP
jgi:hypothetical protein